MIIDIILFIILVLAVIKGYHRGFIVAVFSIVAFIIGLAAAIKLSAVVAGYVGNAVNVSGKWLPILSFAIVFLAVVLLVRLGANLIQKGAQMAMLGLINRLAGILLYAVLYIFIFSIILFYADQVKLVKPETKQSSIAYPYIKPLGPKVIDGFGKIIPIFKNMFTDLQDFFGGVSERIPESN